MDSSNDWSATDFLGRTAREDTGGREPPECMELCLRVNDKSLWVRLKEQTNSGDFVVGAYYRLPDQEEKVHEKKCYS